jgi:hypothetical protein
MLKNCTISRIVAPTGIGGGTNDEKKEETISEEGLDGAGDEMTNRDGELTGEPEERTLLAMLGTPRGLLALGGLPGRPLEKKGLEDGPLMEEGGDKIGDEITDGDTGDGTDGDTGEITDGDTGDGTDGDTRDGDTEETADGLRNETDSEERDGGEPLETPTIDGATEGAIEETTEDNTEETREDTDTNEMPIPDPLDEDEDSDEEDEPPWPNSYAPTAGGLNRITPSKSRGTDERYWPSPRAGEVNVK